MLSRMLFRRLSTKVLSNGKEALKVVSNQKENKKKIGGFGTKLLIGTGLVGTFAASMVYLNIHHAHLLPKPLQTFAVGVEGFERYLIVAYYVSPLVAKWLWIEKWQKTRLSNEELNALRSQAHEKTAATFLKAIRRLGGVFIKQGQHMCASPVLPPIYVETLKVLMDNAIPRHIQETDQTWREEFGVNLKDSFVSINENPIATASLAQVYEAQYIDPESKEKKPVKVAVKIQHRDVARLFGVDLAIGKFYYAAVGLIFPDFDFTYMVEEIERAFFEELDFELEAFNGRKAQKLYQRDDNPIIIPDIIGKYSTRKVLTMKFEEGFRIDDVKLIKENGLNKAKIVTELVKIFSEMMFVTGYVHCDPHPGNILVRKTTNPRNKYGFDIILLDHGSYQTLTDDVRCNYAKIWKGVITADQKMVEEATVKGFGIDKKFARFVGFALTFTPPTKDPLIANVDTFSQDEWEDLALDILEAKDMQEVNDRFSEFSKVFELLPRSLLLILKSNNLIRFINEQLGSPVNRFSIMGSYCVKGVLDLETRGQSRFAAGIKRYYELAKIRLFTWLHPLFQLAIEYYLKFAFPKLGNLINKRGIQFFA